jgi:hypothetical protein
MLKVDSDYEGAFPHKQITEAMIRAMFEVRNLCFICVDLWRKE